jgi:uncharacterized membrane protein required for colicin V production
MIAAQSSTTLQQFSADAILVVLIIINAILGWRTGTLRRVVSFAGLYAGVLAAYYMGNYFASLVRKGDIFANAWSFVAVTLVVVVAFEVIGAFFKDRLAQLATFTFDRIAGTIIGAAVGFFQASVLFMVALAVGAAPSSPANTIPFARDVPANAIRNAPLSGQAIRAQPALTSIFAPMFSTSNLTTHLEDSTQLTAP